MYDGNIEKTIHKAQDGPLLLPPLPFPYTASPLLFREMCIRDRRMARPLSFDDETLAYDNMEEVGPGNTFLETCLLYTSRCV